MEAMAQPIPRTADEVFNDFKGRRAGLIKALTTGMLGFFVLHVVVKNVFLNF